MPNIKLGYTDIEPTDRRFAVNQARTFFLEAIRENASEVLEDLSTVRFTTPFTDCAKSTELKNWVNRWNLDADWIVEIACETLESWHQLPFVLGRKIEFSVNDIWEKQDELLLPDGFLGILAMMRNAENAKISLGESSVLIEKLVNAGIVKNEVGRELFWSFLSVGWQVFLNDLKLLDAPKDLPIWKADSESRAFYVKRFEALMEVELEEGFFSDISNEKNFKQNIREAKRKTVNTYCDEVVKAYLALKDERGNALWTRTEEKSNIKRNAVWAVKFQVLKQDFSAIAKDENLYHSTVMREVEIFLELIGLTKKETKRGRREGGKNSILATLGR